MAAWLSDLFLRSQNDERLVLLAAAGESRAFGVIAERYRQELQAYARRFDDQHAEDLVQQTFLAAFTAVQSGTEVRHLRGWLYQIMRHAALRAASSSAEAEDAVFAAEHAVAAGGMVESAQEAAERHMLTLDALAAVAELPGRQRDAFVQTAIQGRSRTEIASIMGLSDAAVRQLVHRARCALRTTVTALTPLPVARWTAGLGSGASPGLPELAAGGGAASAGTLTLKLGALVASGALATGVAVIGRIPQHSHGHRNRNGSGITSEGPMTPGDLSRVETARAAQLAVSSLGKEQRAATPIDGSASRGMGERSDGSPDSSAFDDGHGRGQGSSSSSSSGRLPSSSDGSAGSGSGRPPSSSDGSAGSGSSSTTSGGDSAGSRVTGTSGSGSENTTTTTTTTSASSDGGGSDSGGSGSTTTTSGSGDVSGSSN